MSKPLFQWKPLVSNAVPIIAIWDLLQNTISLCSHHFGFEMMGWTGFKIAKMVNDHCCIRYDSGKYLSFFNFLSDGQKWKQTPFFRLLTSALFMPVIQPCFKSKVKAAWWVCRMHKMHDLNAHYQVTNWECLHGEAKEKINHLTFLTCLHWHSIFVLHWLSKCCFQSL